MNRVWLHTHLPRLRSGETPDVISVKIPGQRIDYASWVSVRDVEFKVHEQGRQRCILEGVRNVHAWVVGDEILRLSGKVDRVPVGFRRAVYDPFKCDSFVDWETFEPVHRAAVAIVSGKFVYYV